MSTDDENKARLFRVRKTVHEMLQDRGYTVIDTELNLSLDDFKERYKGESIRKDMTMLLQNSAAGDANQIFVFFHDDQKFTTKNVQDFVMTMNENEVKRAIFVIQQALTTFAKEAIAQFRGTHEIETFQENELLVNIMKHVLVPEHRAMSDDDKKALLKRYNLKPSQLPRIQQNDPCARYLGLKKGQVVRIVRSSETAGRYVTYRLVV